MQCGAEWCDQDCSGDEVRCCLGETPRQEQDKKRKGKGKAQRGGVALPLVIVAAKSEETLGAQCCQT